MDCLFCKIIAKQMPAHIVYEDEKTLAFLDVNPRAPGHAMVIPKNHAENILDLPEEDIHGVFSAVKSVTGKISGALSPDGFTIGINHGRVSGQMIDHLHIHIIPRWNDDRGGSIHSVVDNTPSETLEEIAEKIKSL